MGHYTEEILRNAKKINELKKGIDESVKYRDKNDHKRKEWQKTCAVFHSQYDSLAFPGGFEGAFKRIVKGDKKAMEAAICFLECRPYFYRSGYMFRDILKKAKKAPLDQNQKERLKSVITAYNEYRKTKKT